MISTYLGGSAPSDTAASEVHTRGHPGLVNGDEAETSTHYCDGQLFVCEDTSSGCASGGMKSSSVAVTVPDRHRNSVTVVASSTASEWPMIVNPD